MSSRGSGAQHHSPRSVRLGLVGASCLALAAGCALVGTSEPVLELSRAEGEFYRDLRPALHSGREAFERSAGALEKAVAALEENRLIEESMARRAEVYQSVARDLAAARVSGEALQRAVDDLIKTDLRIQEQVRAFAAAGEIRRKAAREAFDALDRSLRLAIENQQAIQAHLEGRGGVPSWHNVDEAVRWLKEAAKVLQEQFQLAGEIAREASAKLRGEPTPPQNR